MPVDGVDDLPLFDKRRPPRSARSRAAGTKLAAEDLIAWAVDKRVGSVKNKEPSLIEPEAGAV